MISPGNKAAVTGQKRQIFRKRPAQKVNQIAMMPHCRQVIAKGFWLRGQTIIAAIGFGQQIADRKGTGQTVTHCRQITRTTTPDRQTRKRAFNVGTFAKGCAQIGSQRIAIMEIFDQIKAFVDFIGIGQRRRQTCGQQSCPGTGFGAINNRKKRSLALARLGLDQFK